MIHNNSHKGFTTSIFIVLAVLILIFGGVSYFAVTPQSQTTNDTPVILGETMEKKEGETMMKKEEGVMVKKEDGVAMMTKYIGTVLAGTSAPLLEYNKADYDAAITSDKLVVLYFYANWCPICKEETKNALYPAFNELTTDKVVGIRINFKDSDTDTDEESLARQYGVPYQHTKVFVKNGKQILKSPAGWDKARYATEIQKALAQ